MKIETLEVAGFYPAFKGMRNAKNNWHLSDSNIYADRHECSANYIIGEKDLQLATNLIKAGSEHSKFMRMIHVWADMDMPKYFWSEFDTYHYNTKNSCSTMHKLFETDKDITLDNFYYTDPYEETVLLAISKELNKLKNTYFLPNTQEIKDAILTSAKRILPESYLQLRTVDTNYAELRNIYHQRKNHRLYREWQDTFCEWVKTLPYSELITMEVR